MRNILVPTSFSDTSKYALQHAYLIAKELGASLNLIHCYSPQVYNRKYDFGTIDYDKGIRQMMKDFYEKSIEDVSVVPIKYLAYEGAASEIISQISPKYDLIILSRKPGFQSKSHKWFSEKIFYISMKSYCSVLLLPTNKEVFYFSEIKKIWHLQKKENDTDLINRELFKLKIDPKIVISKSLQQETFVSALWKSIVTYTKNQDDASMKKIISLFEDEHLDLLVFVNHKKGLFEKFLIDDALNLISQFDVPILILEENPVDSESI